MGAELPPSLPEAGAQSIGLINPQMSMSPSEVGWEGRSWASGRTSPPPLPLCPPGNPALGFQLALPVRQSVPTR
jgi:hypothetical protein